MNTVCNSRTLLSRLHSNHSFPMPCQSTVLATKSLLGCISALTYPSIIRVLLCRKLLPKEGTEVILFAEKYRRKRQHKDSIQLAQAQRLFLEVGGIPSRASRWVASLYSEPPPQCRKLPIFRQLYQQDSYNVTRIMLHSAGANAINLDATLNSQHVNQTPASIRL